jgi:hypothetical protein
MRIGYKHIKSSWANRERIVSHLARGTAHQRAKFTAAYLSVAHVCANRSELWRKPFVRRRSEALSRAEGHFFISLTHALFLRKTWDSFQFLQGGHFNPITQSWHHIAKRVFHISGQLGNQDSARIYSKQRKKNGSTCISHRFTETIV